MTPRHCSRVRDAVQPLERTWMSCPWGLQAHSVRVGDGYCGHVMKRYRHTLRELAK